ncbi:MAG: hypothetical protein V8R41_00570 [Dorea formicigenerans]
MQFQGLKEDSYEYVKDAANQVYTVTTDPGMFSVTEATLSKTAEGMKAKVTLKGTGYDVLYLGSDEDAKKD